MTDVFFSYSNKDRERVRPIFEALRAEKKEAEERADARQAEVDKARAEADKARAEADKSRAERVAAEEQLAKLKRDVKSLNAVNSSNSSRHRLSKSVEVQLSIAQQSLIAERKCPEIGSAQCR